MLICLVVVLFLKELGNIFLGGVPMGSGSRSVRCVEPALRPRRREMLALIENLCGEQYACLLPDHLAGRGLVL